MRLGSRHSTSKVAVDTSRGFDPKKKLIAPVELVINLETVADLASLWSRFNMSAEVLADAAIDAAANGKKGAFSDEFCDLLEVEPEGKREIWKFLNSKMKENQISPR